MKKLPAIIVGVVLFVVLVIAGFRVLGSRAADTKPLNVTVSDITGNTAKVNWTTESASIGAVKYGTSEGSLNFYAPESIKDASTTHSVELTLLSPGSTYYFQIQIGDKLYDNGGVSWTFSTSGADGKQGAAPSIEPTTAAGSVLPPTSSVSPAQKLHVPGTAEATAAPTQPPVCSETSCEAIKAKLGNGCDTQYYIKMGCLSSGESTP